VSSGSIVVEHLPHHPKVKGLNPVVAAEIGRDISKKLNSKDCLNKIPQPRKKIHSVFQLHFLFGAFHLVHESLRGNIAYAYLHL